MSTEHCPASIQYMDTMNKSMKPYGTPYLLPDTLVEGCIFKYICKNECCLKSQKEYFTVSPYPNEKIKLVEEGGECEELKEYTQKIYKYYGFYSHADVEGEINTLAPLIKGIWDANRTVYVREFDRILCTNAFRHLQYKTQVMVNSASDDQRTRLMHSLEVKQIAKKMALGIGANHELAETIAIAHDIGHAPFGHGGESTINDYLVQQGCGRFSHALQSVKVLDNLCVHPILDEFSIQGLGISQFVLEGVLKHDSDSFTDGMDTGNFKAQYNVDNLFGIVGESKEDYTKQINDWLRESNVSSNPQIPQVLIGSVEAQIAAWADKIAYLGHDWEEFIDTQLLEKLMSRVNDMVLKMYKIHNDIQLPNDKEQELIGKILDELNGISERYASVPISGGNDCFKAIWKNRSDTESVYNRVDRIIRNVDAIFDTGHFVSKDNNTRYFQYFSEEEYQMLRNYFLMTISWVELLEVYPRSYGMKEDPIYVFYMYLTQIRSNIVSPNVVNKIIDRTMSYVQQLNENLDISPKTRCDYLVYCNKLWVYKYNMILNEKDSKVARKTLKDSVRTCFLVGFHDEVQDKACNTVDEKEYMVKRNKYGYYAYDGAYQCLLNIIKITLDEFIGSTRVKFMKHTANKIVLGLLNYYVENPDMLPYAQRNRLNKEQHKLALLEVPEMSEITREEQTRKNLYRVVADYVASMTDRMAKLKYDEIMSSDTKWRNEYVE